MEIVPDIVMEHSHALQHTEITSIPFPFKLNGIWWWWQFSFRFWTKWISIWFTEIGRKTVTTIISDSILKGNGILVSSVYTDAERATLIRLIERFGRLWSPGIIGAQLRHPRTSQYYRIQGGGSQLGSHDVRDVRLSVRFSRRAGFCSRSRNSRLSCGVLLRGSLKPLQHHGIMVTRGLKAALHFKFFKKNGKNPVYIFRCNFLQSLENENKGTGLHRWQEQTFSYSFFHSFLFHSENTYTPSNGLYFRSRFGS